MGSFVALLSDGSVVKVAVSKALTSRLRERFRVFLEDVVIVMLLGSLRGIALCPYAPQCEHDGVFYSSCGANCRFT